MKTCFCPACGRKVPLSHFTCANIAKATAHSGTGAKKRRPPEHYARMVEIRRERALARKARQRRV